MSASVGSVADSYDNAMAEALNCTFKAELIHRRTRRTRDQVEYAVMEWVGRYNHHRLHTAIGNVPPAEYEANHLPFDQASSAARHRPAPGRPDFTKPVGLMVLREKVEVLTGD